VAGRGKAGGILFANSIEDTEKAAEKLLNMQIKGIPVRSVWIEEKIQVKKELYFGVTTDRFNQSYIAIASSVGGMDVEEIATKTPEKIIKLPINPNYGFHSFHARQAAIKWATLAVKYLNLEGYLKDCTLSAWTTMQN
jgi:succinyl-CoA synthetase beta subunit